jgi:SAM-dependent methyltransferase
MSDDGAECRGRTELDAGDREAIVRRYSDRLSEYGIDLRTLNVGPQEKYRTQHAVHASIGDLTGKVLLDVGCGLAHYYEFLRAQGTPVRYIGYDIVPPFIEMDRERFPEATFDVRDVTSEDIAHQPDYVVMCQVFNNRYQEADNTEVVQAVLRKTFEAARIGVSIDMLSSYVTYREPNLAYFSPDEMFRFAKGLTRFVRLRHDYAPFHFTLFLYKDAVPA